MSRTGGRSDSWEIEPGADGQRDRFSGLGAHVQKPDELLETVLDISTQIKPKRLRRKFSGLVKSGRKAERRCMDLLNEKNKCEDDALKDRVESAREKQAMRQEIAKLKEVAGTFQRQNANLQQQNADFQQQRTGLQQRNANLQQQNTDLQQQRTSLQQRNTDLQQQNTDLQQQNANLQQQIRERGMVHRRDEAPARTLRKRQRAQSSDGECEDSDDHLRERVRLRVNSGDASRDQIRSVLGGSDRGWGSTRSCPGIYMYHTLLDPAAHLFGQTLSPRQNAAEAVLGFGPDDDVISGAIVFPLFIRNQSEHRSRFTYMGNYVATRLDPVAWERLPEEGKKCAVQTVQSKGLSADSSLHKMEKAMKYGAIDRQFHHGIFKVPCSRLEFRDFDEELNIDIQNAPGRRTVR